MGQERLANALPLPVASCPFNYEIVRNVSKVRYARKASSNVTTLFLCLLANI